MPFRGLRRIEAITVDHKGQGLRTGRIDHGAAASLVAACTAMIVALPAASGEFSLVVPAVSASALATVLALALGYTAKARIERSRGFLRGHVLAIAGIVLGWIEVAAWILLPFLATLVMSWATRNCPSPCLYAGRPTAETSRGIGCDAFDAGTHPS